MTYDADFVYRILRDIVAISSCYLTPPTLLRILATENMAPEDKRKK